MEIEYTNIDLVILDKTDGYSVIVTQYYYYHSKIVPIERVHSSSTTWVWKTNCKELVRKVREKRTKVFLSQLIALAKTYGVPNHIKYPPHPNKIKY